MGHGRDGLTIDGRLLGRTSERLDVDGLLGCPSVSFVLLRLSNVRLRNDDMSEGLKHCYIFIRHFIVRAPKNIIAVFLFRRVVTKVPNENIGLYFLFGDPIFYSARLGG